MTKPLVAIIMRTKDRPLLLSRAISSVVGQTLPDWRLIIVNDGGDVKQINELLEKNKKGLAGRAKIISNRTSLGMQEAANVGIKDSDSKYVAILDDDDTWHPDFLRTTVEFLENKPYEAVVTGSTIIKETIEGQKIKKLGEERFVPTGQIYYFAMLGANMFPNNTFVYSRKAYKEIGDYDQSVDVLGDWKFNIQFMRLYDIGFIDVPLAYYHHRQSAKGADTNTIYGDSHEKYRSQLLNKLIRDDLDKGTLGIGLMANLSHLIEGMRAELAKELLDIKQDNRNRLSELNEAIEHREQLIEQKNQEIRLIKASRFWKLRNIVARLIGKEVID